MTTHVGCGSRRTEGMLPRPDRRGNEMVGLAALDPPYRWVDHPGYCQGGVRCASINLALPSSQSRSKGVFAMRPWDEDCLHLGLDDSEQFDPLRASGSLPLTDEDIDSIQRAVRGGHAGTAVDRRSDRRRRGRRGNAARRTAYRQPCAGRLSDDPVAIEANARLIRQARCLLLRLLRERDRWQHERTELLARLREWESPNRPASVIPAASFRFRASVGCHVVLPLPEGEGT